MATQIPADRVLVFLASWDGRYYWDYPNYKVAGAHGRRSGLPRLITEARSWASR